MQSLLVTLERQHVIGALIDHLLGDLALAAHRVGSDDAALERQQFQQLGHRHDLVRLVADRKLAQTQPRVGCPSAYQMQRRSLRGTVEGAPHRLPVDRHNAVAALGKMLHEADEPGVEAGRIEQPEDPAESVVARNPVWQCQELLQKISFGAAEQRHIRTSLAAA